MAVSVYSTGTHLSRNRNTEESAIKAKNHPAKLFMEKVLEHEIERELAAGPPRPIRATPSTTLLLATAAALFVVFVYGGSKALIESAKVAWLATRGQKATATITTLIYSDGRRGAPSAEPANQVVGMAYTFRDEHGALRFGLAAQLPSPPASPPGEYLHDDPIPKISKPAANAAPLLVPGQTLPIRYANWGGKIISGPADSPPARSVLFLAFAGLLVLGVSALLFTRMLRGIWLHVKLLRHGLATVGTIVLKSSQTEDSLRYSLRYGYADTAGKLHEREDVCTVEQFRLFDIGQPVTVLYSSQDPTRAALYALIPFRCPSASNG
jgi:hypothetical protein